MHALRHRQRKGIAAVLSVIIIFAMIVVVLVGFFAFMLNNNLMLNQAAQSRQQSQLVQAGEHLSLTVAGYSSGPEFGIRISNTGSVSSTITAVYVTSPSGQALSQGAGGSEYLVGPTALNITLPLSIPPGSSTAMMSACSGKACNIGISSSALSYGGHGDVEIGVLTQSGGVFTAQYPTSIAVSTTTSTSSGSTSTATLPGGSQSTTSVTTSTVQQSWSGTTTVLVGQGTPSLILSLSAVCTTVCASQSVLSGGTITVTASVTNMATTSATLVSLVMNPLNGVPTGTASVAPSGACSPATATISAGGVATFTCLYTASTGASGGTITFDGYAMGTISGNAQTSANAASNTLQVGYSSAGAPIALNPFSFNYTSVGQTATGHNGISAALVSDAATYVALYVTVTNVYGQPLTLMDLTDISTQSPYVGADPAFYMVSGVTYPGSGNPTITPYNCYPGSSISGCTTIPVGGTATLIFAACNPNNNVGNYGAGSTTWVWTTNGQLGEADSSPNCGGGTLGFAPPVGSSISFVLFYVLGTTTSGTMYSSLLPFSSMFVTLPTTVSLTTSPAGCTKVDLGQGTVTCEVTVTCTDPYGSTSGSPTQGCTNSHTPIGNLLITVTPTSGLSPTSTQCTLSSLGNTQAQCSVTFTPSAVGSYTVSASYGGDSEHGPSSGSATLTINPALTAGAITPSAPIIDSGQSITLTANPAGGTTPYAYAWYTSSSCSGTSLGSAATYSASPTSTTTYYYKVTDSATTPETACSSGDTVTVKSALTAGAITPSSPKFDTSQTVTLTSAASGGTGTFSYQWYTAPSSGTCNTGDTAISGATSSMYAIPTSAAAGTYYYCYIVTDTGVSAGATPAATAGSATDTVVISSTLSASAITPASPKIDSGQSITLTANPSAGTTPYTYQWYTGASCTAAISGATGVTYSASPTSSTTYYYKVTDSSTVLAETACSAGDTVTVNSALAAPAAPTVSFTKLDVNQALTVTGTIPSSGTPTYSWQWLISVNGGAFAAATQCATNSGTGASGGATETCSLAANSLTGGNTYAFELQVTDSAYSPASQTSPTSATVTVNPVPAASAITPASPKIDSGQSITLTANPSGGTTPYTYAWYTSSTCTGASLGSAVTYSPSPASTTTYYYKVTDSSPAGAQSACSAGDTVTVNSALAAGTITPATSTIDSGQSITLSAAWSGGTSTYTVTWYSGSSATCSLDTTVVATNSGVSASPNTQSVSPASTTYYCAVIKDSGSPAESVTDAAVKVTVDTAPAAGAITPSSPGIKVGTSQLLTAHASGGTTTYSYQWYTAPSSGTCNTGDTAISGATAATYTVPTTQPAGIYYYCYIVTDTGVSAGATPTATASSATDTVSIRSLTISPTSVSRSGTAAARTVTLTGAGYSTSSTSSYCLSTSSSSISCVSGTTGTFTGSGATGAIPSGTTLVVPSGQAIATYYVMVYSGATILQYASLSVTA